MQTPSDSGSSVVFFQTYRDCRAAFLGRAHDVGAIVQSRLHPTLKGRDGEDLAIDTAYLGEPGAKRLLVMSSGVHGYEGFAGGALQLDTLSRLSAAITASPDVAVLLIHGVNPFGWSHYSRTNENNVDLNRNFIAFDEVAEEHRLARDIQALNDFGSATGPDFERIVSGLQSLGGVHGAEAVSDAIQRGQYFQPDGVGYGGDGPQWSNRVLREVWSAYFADRDLVCMIDWHTGLGTYGEPVFLCFDPPVSGAYRLASDWWGPAALSGANAAYDSGSRPSYSGLMAVAAQETARASGAVAVGAVIEFGTFKPAEAARCLWIDRWLRRPPADVDATSFEALQQHARRFFYPDEAGWKESVLTSGRLIVDEALRGLRNWDVKA